MGVFTTSKQFALGLNLTAPWWLSGASVDLDFRNGRYYDSSLSALKQPLASITDYLSITRASTGYAQNSAGTWVLFNNNQFRITDLGLLVEDARTNYLLNSDSPATQTTASLGTGSYTLWVNGSGSALASGGSATITGASSATDGNPDVFSVTVAGTVVVTVSGSLTRFQLENAPGPSSYIPTAGATVTRAADAITTGGTLLSTLQGTASSAVVDVIEGFDDSTIIPSVIESELLKQDLTHVRSNSDDSTIILPVIGNSLTWITGFKLGSSNNASGRSCVAGGGTVLSDAKTMTWPLVGGNLRLGSRNVGSGSYLGGFIRRLTIWNSRLADATLQGLTYP